MKVWVLQQGCVHEGGGVVGVYTDQDLARAHLHELVDLENEDVALWNRRCESSEVSDINALGKRSYYQPDNEEEDWFQCGCDYFAMYSVEADIEPTDLKEKRQFMEGLRAEEVEG